MHLLKRTAFVLLPALLLAVLAPMQMEVARSAPEGDGFDLKSLPTKPPAEPIAIMPTKDLRPGMKGYGLTVFKGTKIEPFGVTILGVLPQANLGRPLVLVRLHGGPITERRAFLIQGMSGSPIYVDNKLVGAFSMGNAWAKEPIGMVTPAEDMLEALDPRLPTTPAGLASVDVTLPRMARAALGFGRALISAQPVDPAERDAAFIFRPLALPLVVSGMSRRNLRSVADFVQPFHLAVKEGPGQMKDGPAAPLTPGAGIGVQMMSGDVTMTGIGTVTYRKGKQLLAFGHPMMQLGPARFPITTTYIHEIFPGFQISHKIGSPIKAVGSLTQDRAFSVAGEVGPLPEMVPVVCRVENAATGRKHTLNVQVANHPMMIGLLVPIAVNESIYELQNVPADMTATIRFAVHTEGLGVIVRENMVYDSRQVDILAVREISELMRTLTTNQFQRVPVKRVEVDVKLEPKRSLASIARIYLNQDSYEPGDTIDIGVIVRPYRGEPVLRRLQVKVPKSAASGTATLVVHGGTTRPRFTSGGPGRPPGGRAGLPGGAPVNNIRQVVREFLKRPKNNDLVARLIFNTSAINVKGQPLSGLPSHLAAAMRSERTSGLVIERDEARVAVGSDFYLRGLQTLRVRIQKKDWLEKKSTTKPGSGRSSSSRPGSPPLRPRPRLPLSAALDLPDAQTALDQALRLMVAESLGARLSPEDEEKPTASKPKKADDKASSKAKPGSTKPAAKADETKSEDKKSKADSKLIGRKTKQWLQSAQKDFAAGQHRFTAVSTRGDVRLAPEFHPLTETAQQYVWSVVAVDDGAAFGTGDDGLVIRVDGAGKTLWTFRTGELEVLCLARDQQGNVYAGTAPNGKIFRIDAQGKGKELHSQNASGEAATDGTKFVLSLAAAPDGNVYAGTGPIGHILRITPDGNVSQIARLEGGSITALLPGPEGALYIGTAEDGRVCRLTPDGSCVSLLSTGDKVVSGLARNRAGVLFAATAPKGAIYAIKPDGSHEEWFKSIGKSIHALTIDSRDNLYAAAGNTVYMIGSDRQATLLTDSKRAQFLGLAWDSQQRLLAASGNPGVVFRSQVKREGAFVSLVHDAGQVARWGRIRWTAEIAPMTKLTVETRSGNTPQPDESWSAWEAPVLRGRSTFVASPPARFLQYQVAFSSSARAILREIRVSYLPKNRPPTLQLEEPKGGEIWQGSKTIKWKGADPDKDTLTYLVFYSADNGQTWKPVSGEEGEKSTSKPTATRRETKAPSEEEAMEALEALRKRLDQQTNLSEEDKAALMERAKSLLDRIRKEQEAEAGNAEEKPQAEEKPEEKKDDAKDDKPAKADEKEKPKKKTDGSTRAGSIKWDTTQVPDGRYLLRVVATDRASNPTEPLFVQKIGEPFIVVNTPPMVFVFERGAEIHANRRAELTGFSTAEVSLAGAQFRVDEGDWFAIDADDGIWDGALESFKILTDPLEPGEHTVETKVVDAAGNVTVTSVKVKLPEEKKPDQPKTESTEKPDPSKSKAKAGAKAGKSKKNKKKRKKKQ